MAIEMGVLVGLIGCAIGVFGWLHNRDKRVSNDAEWRGEVNAKLDIAIGIRKDVDAIDGKVRENAERVIRAEQSIASAHKRIDELIGGTR